PARTCRCSCPYSRSPRAWWWPPCCSCTASPSCRGCAPISCRASRTSCAPRWPRSGCSPKRCCSAACARTASASARSRSWTRRLVNLLDNAGKYGPADQTITVGLDAGDGKALIRVEDQGPGIPAAERERIWDRFWRLERDRGSAVAGTGIGLSVVRELVALHGGRAWAEEGRGGTGARFVLELPLVGQPQAAPGPAPMRADFGATA